MQNAGKRRSHSCAEQISKNLQRFVMQTPAELVFCDYRRWKLHVCQRYYCVDKWSLRLSCRVAQGVDLAAHLRFYQLVIHALGAQCLQCDVASGSPLLRKPVVGVTESLGLCRRG